MRVRVEHAYPFKLSFDFLPLLYHNRPTMSVRPSTKREKDIEKLLSPEQQLAEDQDVDSSGKTTKARARSMYAKYGWIAWAFGVFFYLSHSYTATEFPWPGQPAPVPDYVKQGMEQCKIIVRSPPNPKPFNHRRTESDRFVPGTGDVLLRNATVWTGNDDGEEILREADVLLSGGVIKHVGKADKLDVALFKDAKVVELHSSWITPGIVDMHSHMGIDAAPAMKGTGEDTNSLKAPILPWLRSLDGLNTHDLAFNLSISGGMYVSVYGVLCYAVADIQNHNARIAWVSWQYWWSGIHLQAPLDSSQHPRLDAGRPAIHHPQGSQRDAALGTYRRLEAHQARVRRESNGRVRQ